MQPEVWYKASDLRDVFPVKKRRITELLSELEEQRKLDSTGATKGKRYRKK